MAPAAPLPVRVCWLRHEPRALHSALHALQLSTLLLPSLRCSPSFSASRRASNMQLFLSAVLVLLLVAVSSRPASAAEYFISSSLGSDSNSGTDAQHPWATVMALTSRKAQLAAGDVVHLCNTDQFLAQALTFNFLPTAMTAAFAAPRGAAAAEAPAKAATASSSPAPPMAGPVSIVGDWSCQQPSAPLSSAPASFPVLSPAVRLKGPTEGYRSAWQPVVVDGKTTQLLSYDVSDVIDGAAGSAAAAGEAPPTAPPVITAVWCGGQRLIQARDPDLLDFNHRQGVDFSEFKKVNATASNLTMVVSSDLKAPPWWYGNLTVRVRTTEWTYEQRTALPSVDQRVPGAVQVQGRFEYAPTDIGDDGKSCGFYLEAGPRCYQLVAFNMLSRPGEWWYSAANRTLYVLPLNSRCKSGADATDVVLDSSLQAVQILGLSSYSLRIAHVNVTRCGLNGCVGVGPNLNTTRVDLEEVHISQSQGYGLSSGSSNRANTPAMLSVVQSSISDVDNPCVSLGWLSDEHVPEIRSRLVDSEVARCGMNAGQGISGDGGAWAVYCEHTLVGNNRIHDIGYIGIRPAFHSVIEHNVIDRVCLALNDCAAIYVWSDPDGRGVVARHNVVTNSSGNVVSSAAGYGVFANSLYLDDNTGYSSLLNNTCAGADTYCIFVHNSHDCVIDSNVCWDGPVGWQEDNVFPMINNTLSRNRLYRNGSRSLNTAIAPFLVLRTANNNTDHWFVSRDNRYCDLLSPEHELSLFEQAIGWLPAWYSNLTDWLNVTRTNPDVGSRITCDMDDTQRQRDEQPRAAAVSA